MIVTGHQPAYLPWLGLIHKASLADVFIYMDDVQYLEQDWNNRNKIKTSAGVAKWLSVPVDLKTSSSRVLKDIVISPEEDKSESKRWYSIHWATLQASYGKAPFFKDYKDFFESLYMGQRWTHLSALNLALLRQIFIWFSISAKIEIASELNFTKSKSDLVLEHAKKFNAKAVVTGIMGKDYIQTEDFKNQGVYVEFQDYQHPKYEQRFGEFVSHLAFVDLLFQHGPQAREICLGGNLTREQLCHRISN